MSTTRPPAICVGCSKTPAELIVYSPEFTGEEKTAEEYVWSDEGTLNRLNGHFLCDGCYIAAGMPAGPGGWCAP